MTSIFSNLHSIPKLFIFVLIALDYKNDLWLVNMIERFRQPLHVAVHPLDSRWHQ